MLGENEIKTILVAIIPLILAFACWKVKLLTKDGAIASVVVGYIIGFSTKLEWLLILILFTAIGFGVTLYRLSKKKEKGLQEGTHGERTWKNVLGVSVPCCIFAVAALFTDPGSEIYQSMFVGYVATVAVASADTTASEVGVKDEDVWMITSLERVKPGVDGGISLTGTAVSLLAATITALFAWFVVQHGMDQYVLIPILAGFLGCILDSIVGATWETKGLITKYGNNCLTGFIGGIIGFVLTYLTFCF